MRFLALAAVLSASLTAAQYLKQTPTFGLGLKSANKSYDGTHLVACHEGAAYEGLCWASSLKPSPDSSSLHSFRLNFTDTPSSAALLTYNFGFQDAKGIQTLWVPLSLNLSPVSNVAVPLFFPSQTGEAVFTFTKEDQLVLYGQSNWYMCDTVVGTGYRYNSLVWAVGSSPKQADLDNKSCVKVDVVKE